MCPCPGVSPRGSSWNWFKLVRDVHMEARNKDSQLRSPGPVSERAGPTSARWRSEEEVRATQGRDVLLPSCLGIRKGRDLSRHGKPYYPSDTETGTSSQMPRPKGVSFLHSSEMSRAEKPPGKSPHLLTQCLWTGKERPLSSFSLGMRRGSFGMLCNAAPPFLLPAPCLPVRYATSTKRCCPECKISLELRASVCPPRGRGSGWLGP